MMEYAVYSQTRSRPEDILKRGLRQSTTKRRKRLLLRLEREMRASRRRRRVEPDDLYALRSRVQPYEHQLERTRATQREAEEQLRQLGRPIGPQ